MHIVAGTCKRRNAGPLNLLHSRSLNQCVLLFYTSYKGETLRVRSHAVKSIWKCRPPGGGHFGVGFINQTLLAKVSPLDKVSFCKGVGVGVIEPNDFVSTL